MKQGYSNNKSPFCCFTLEGFEGFGCASTFLIFVFLPASGAIRQEVSPCLDQGGWLRGHVAAGHEDF